jgi:Ca2+-transporting ATPase
MGTGTEVSKEASDMVLADDNFSTIVSAVEEGRTIYANMQAFICFLISCNIGEICAIFFATLAGFPEPLTAMHLLWVNLVTDGPPATALGFNPPAPDIMDAPPRPSDEPIMTKWLLTRYVLTGLYVGLATIGIFVQHYLQQGLSLSELSNWSQCGTYWTPQNGGAEACSALFRESGRMLPQTLALTTLICMEMLKALSAVSVDSSLLQVSPLRNKWLLLGVSGPFLLHLAVVYSSELGIPGLGEAFGMASSKRTTFVFPCLGVSALTKYVCLFVCFRSHCQLTTGRMSYSGQLLSSLLTRF